MARRVYSSASASNNTSAQQSAPLHLNSSASNTANSKGNGVVSALLYVLMGAFLVGGGAFGIMAYQAGQETASVVQNWDELREIADSPSGNTPENSPSGDSSENGMWEPQGQDSFLGNDYGEDGMEDDGGELIPTGQEISASEAYVMDPMDREINWDALYEINTQVKCWIYIPGTNIDYPVIQEKNIGTYQYLDHDIYGNSLKSGCIVTPCQPDGTLDADAHFIILGHNMKNKTMFGTLKKYTAEEFYKSYPSIYIYYPDRTEQWSVWSSYYTTEADIIYDMPYELNSKSFTKLITQIENSKLYPTMVTNTDPSRKILTLSTCHTLDNTNRGRFVVNAVLDVVKNIT